MNDEGERRERVELAVGQRHVDQPQNGALRDFYVESKQFLSNTFIDTVLKLLVILHDMAISDCRPAGRTDVDRRAEPLKALDKAEPFRHVFLISTLQEMFMEDLIADLRQLAEQKAEAVHQETELWSRVAAAFANFSEQQFRLAKHRAHAGQHETNGDRATYLSTKQAAEYLGVKPSTLNGWRFSGGGQVYVKMGRSVRYKRDDLDDFAAKNTNPHTSAYRIDR